MNETATNDAFRAVLLPATTKLLRGWNWYLPAGSSGFAASRAPSQDAASDPRRRP
jgi:hypothetical protein